MNRYDGIGEQQGDFITQKYSFYFFESNHESVDKEGEEKGSSISPQLRTLYSPMLEGV